MNGTPIKDAHQALEAAARRAGQFVQEIVDHPRLSNVRADEIEAAIRALSAQIAPPADVAVAQLEDDVAHSDDVAVNKFAATMKAKLALARSNGRSGWDDPEKCSTDYLAILLLGHINKGNEGTFVDIANFAMMLHLRDADPRVLAALNLPPEPQSAAQVQSEMREKALREVAAYHDGMAADETSLSMKYRGGSNPWFAHVQSAKFHKKCAAAILNLIKEPNNG